MKFHGIQLQEGSSVKNMTVDSGSVFPDEPNNGELFFLTSADEAVMGMHVYIGSSWHRIGTQGQTGADVEVNADHDFAINWFEARLGKKYDFLGLAGFIVRLIPGEKNRYFCSEAAAEALGFKNGWRFTPNALFSALVRY